MDLDPTLDYQDFAVRFDHAAAGQRLALAAWETYKAECHRLRHDDPDAFARAEVAGLEARIAECRRAMRIYVRLFRRTGDRVLYKENGVEFEKSLLRLWTTRLKQVRKRLASDSDLAAASQSASSTAVRHR